MVNISEHFSFEVSKIKQVTYCIADNSIAVQLAGNKMRKGLGSSLSNQYNYSN